jgi:hypothetical protein
MALHDCFPKIDAGTTGPAIRLSIAGIRIAVSSADAGMKLALDGNLARFAAPPGKIDVNLLASWNDLAGFDCGEEIFDSGGAWRLSSRGNEYLIRCCAPRFGTIPYQIARFSRDFTRGEVFLHRPFFNPGAPINPLQYPLDEVIMLHLLARGRGVEMHACGVVDAAGGGYLFSGHSGAGKTTMARLWSHEPGITILSDDRIILRLLDGQYWMYGTPWHGEAEFAEPRRASLHQIFFLRHGTANALIRKSGAEAAAMLFTRTFPTFHDRDGIDFTLEFYQGLTERVPCSELSVVPDRNIIQFLQDHGCCGD